MKQKNKNYPNKLKCKICSKEFQHLGSHIWHKHKLFAREYKEKFELPYNEALISEKIYHKKRKHWINKRNHYLKNLKKGLKYQFRKGHTGQRRISASERRRFIKRILKINKQRKLEKCPVCNLKFYNLDTHLFGKHQLLRTKSIQRSQK